MSGCPMKDTINSDVLSRYALWVADTRGAKPDYIGSYGMWQYSWKGKINGITGDVDLDYCYVNYPEQIKAAGLNGFGATKPVEKDNPSDDKSCLDIEVIIGGVKYKGKVEKV